MKTEQDRPFRVLFLCTGNSARSVFAEYFLRRLGGRRFESYSAGAAPTGVVNPLAVKVLRDHFGIDASDARSKSWDEFQDVRFDFVITVCDNAREACPVWQGQPIVAHWGVDDPAAFVGTPEMKERFFHDVALTLHRRIQILTSLPLEQLDKLRVEKLTRDIGLDRSGKSDPAAVTGATLRTAEGTDWPAIQRLLSARSLPPDGAEEHLGSFVVAMSGERLVGVAGLERHGDVALLRSVAVAEDSSSTGVGTALVGELVRRSRAEGLRELYLLTTTAARWFPRFGFVSIERSALPASLGASEELRGACPASATAMRLLLRPPTKVASLFSR